MVDWENPYYVPVAVAVKLSAHKRGHIYMMARNKLIGSIFLDETKHVRSLVVSLRDILILERDKNRRGQQSVVAVLESLVPTVYLDSGESHKVLNPWRDLGVRGRLRRKPSIHRQGSE